MLSLEGSEFVNRWAAGQLSAATIEPMEDFGKVFITQTIGRLRDASSNTMHMTHDLVIMGARNILFGTIATKENGLHSLEDSVLSSKETSSMHTRTAES